MFAVEEEKKNKEILTTMQICLVGDYLAYKRETDTEVSLFNLETNQRKPSINLKPLFDEED